MVLLAFSFVYLLLYERDRDPSTSAAAPKIGLTLKQAVQNQVFWHQAATHIVMSLLTNGLMISLVPYLTDQKLTRADAAARLGLFGVTSLLGRLASGFVFDRFRVPPVCAAVYFVAAVATAALAIFGVRFSFACIIVTGLA